MPTAFEVNFDALVGPTHNYAGLSPGNIASATHAGARSQPQAAARQGLRKMKLLADLGFKQAVLPPQERPHLGTLRALGFTGTDEQVLRTAAADAPAILSACCSASSMWAANAATVSPSADTSDGRVHFTPANLVTNFHRSLEPPTTTRVLRAIFADSRRFVVHDPLPATPAFADEGAANHMRFCIAHDKPALEGFVYGRRGIEKAHSPGASSGTGGAHRFPARQTIEACEAIARAHGLKPGASVMVRQNPEAIDQGVFHNDVIAVANQGVLFYHEQAFTPPEEKLLVDACRAHLGDWFIPIRVPAARVSVEDAVGSYLFNSQLLTTTEGVAAGSMMLVCPTECQENPRVHHFIEELLTAESNPILQAKYVDVRQSMNNGGGPACLRLRVVLTDAELSAMHRGVLLTDTLFERLDDWIGRHYRPELLVSDLVDPRLITEGRDALDDLCRILGIGQVYEFQR